MQGDKAELLTKVHADYVNNHILPLVNNASLPPQLDGGATTAARTHSLIFDRVKALLGQKSVVVIGTGTDPRCVIADIPTVVGNEYTYEKGAARITLRLLSTRKAASTSQTYDYSVDDTTEEGITMKSILKFVFFSWASLVLRTEVEELLQLVQFCQNSKESICVSDRHKEVFSLLHLLYYFVVVAETPISLSDAFQLHLAKCNGFLIDRIEMLCVMNFLLTWANSAGVIPKNLLNAATLWRNTYECMAAFRRIHTNVVTIHPDHLPQIAEEAVMEIARAGGFPSPQFSEREDAIMRDRFVYRTHVAVEETDFERKAREGKLKRLKILESEQQKKEKEEEVTDTTVMSKGPPDEDFLKSKRYRGKKTQELWEAEQKQIEELRQKRGAKITAKTPISAATPVKSKTPRREVSQNVAEALPRETKEDIAKEGVQETPQPETPPVFNDESPQKFKTNASANVEDKAQNLQSLDDSKSREKSKPKRNVFARLRNLAAILMRRQPQLQPPPTSSSPSSSLPKKGLTPSARHELPVKSERLRRSMKVAKLMSSSGSPETPLHSPDLIKGAAKGEVPEQKQTIAPGSAPAPAKASVDKPQNVSNPKQKQNDGIPAKPLPNLDESKQKAEQPKPLASPSPMHVPPPPAQEKRGFFTSVPALKQPTGAPIGQAPNIKK
ncbi:hypothetical protein Y032_0064g3565 [Ancylostoma ceylanicum]|nr:hypothetical protein Y032_0064g3565 [Ancylostoma ceylanicum]